MPPRIRKHSNTKYLPNGLDRHLGRAVRDWGQGDGELDTFGYEQAVTLHLRIGHEDTALIARIDIIVPFAQDGLGALPRFVERRIDDDRVGKGESLAIA